MDPGLADSHGPATVPVALASGETIEGAAEVTLPETALPERAVADGAAVDFVAAELFTAQLQEPANACAGRLLPDPYGFAPVGVGATGSASWVVGLYA